MKRMTVRELGDKLPIGIIKDRKLHKDIAVRPYKGYIDAALDTWIEKSEIKYPNLHVLEAAKVAKLISLMFSQMGDSAWVLKDPGDGAKDSSGEQELAVYRLNQCDVFYAYYIARIASLGKDLALDFQCPVKTCRRADTMNYDLLTADVSVCDESDILTSVVELEKPFKLRDGQIAKSVSLRPPTWMMMTKPGVFSGSTSKVTFACLEDSICGVDCIEGPYEMTPPELYEVERADMIRIKRKINSLDVGLDLRTKIICPGCGYEIIDPLNWTHDHFFGESFPASETSSN